MTGTESYSLIAHGGASSTGWGESIVKILLAKTIIDNLGNGMDIQMAADLAITLLEERVKDLGGIICINSLGHVSYSYNTPYMATAIANESGVIHVGI